MSLTAQGGDTTAVAGASTEARARLKFEFTNLKFVVILKNLPAHGEKLVE
jgi:hypothetical protein